MVGVRCTIKKRAPTADRTHRGICSAIVPQYIDFLSFRNIIRLFRGSEIQFLSYSSTVLLPVRTHDKVTTCSCWHRTVHLQQYDSRHIAIMSGLAKGTRTDKEREKAGRGTDTVAYALKLFVLSDPQNFRLLGLSPTILLHII